MVGLVVGSIRMILDFSFPPPLCGKEETRPEGVIKLLDMHYLYFGILLFVITILAAVIVSLCTAPLSNKYVSLVKGIL